jgi:hypothetical protein
MKATGLAEADSEIIRRRQASMSIRDRIAKVAKLEMIWLRKRDRLDREYTSQEGNWAANMMAQDKWHARQARVDRELSRRVRRIKMMA